MHSPADQMSAVMESPCIRMPHHSDVNTMHTMLDTGTAYRKNSHDGNGTAAIVKAVNKIAAITNNEVADGHAVELRDLREDIDIGQPLAPLPLGNGLIGVIELARKVQLGILMGFAVSGDIFCCGAPQRLFVLDHKDAPFP